MALRSRGLHEYSLSDYVSPPPVTPSM
ncbi:MAG: hypothetical protein ACI8RZ_005707, partial [Myxococcota bacterium]